MRAMILAAGRGTRLAPLTDTTPKPLLPIGGKPLIQRQIEQLKRAGFTEIVINLHHLGEQIEAFVGNGSRFDVRVRYSREAELLETGGGIVRALPLLGDAPFLVLNGDVLTDFDFKSLQRDLGDADAHLVVIPKPSYRKHGDFELDDGHVRGRGDAYVFAGIAVMRPEFFAAAPSGPFSWTADHLFKRFGEFVVTAQVFSGSWTDIGSTAQYEAVKDGAWH